MNCPYCNGEMQKGEICTSGNRTLYWLPKDANNNFFILNPQAVEKRNGIVLDMVCGGMITEVRPASYFCRKCSILLTKPGDFSVERA